MDTKSSEEHFFSDIFKFALIAIVFVLPLRLFVAQPYVVNGSSMDPTFANNQYIIVDELSYHIHNPERGDVVVFEFPEDKTKSFIKRIIGLPGETVELKGNSVIIKNAQHPQGFTLDEPYVIRKASNSLTVTLKEGEYFVMGDNRPASYDSRYWGPVPRDLIIGTPALRLLPVHKIDIRPGEYRQDAESPSGTSTASSSSSN